MVRNCTIGLSCYGSNPLYGVTDSPQFDFLAFARVIFAAQQGTLLELGIGPIVTAGLLMQLLKGSDLIKLNFKNPDDRSLFTSATKIVTIIVIIAEGALYGVSVYGNLLAQPYSNSYSDRALSGGKHCRNVS